MKNNQPIFSSQKEFYFCEHYSQFGADELWKGAANEKGFVGRGTLKLVDYAGKYYTGNELLYYPTLALKLREIKRYPTLSHDFKISKEIKGKAFIDYLYHRFTHKFDRFKKMMSLSAANIDDLVKQYGQFKESVIIDDYSRDTFKTSTLTINGIKWEVADNSSYLEEEKDKRYSIHFKTLLGLLGEEYRFLSIQKVILKTSYIALRYRRNYSFKGRVKWFDLNTKEEVSRNIIDKVKDRMEREKIYGQKRAVGQRRNMKTQ